MWFFRFLFVFNCFFFSLLLSAPVLADVQAASSASLIKNSAGSRIFSANFDGGSITAINADGVSQRLEVSVGKDIRRIALNADEDQLLATDYVSGKLLWLRANDLTIEHELNVGGRPFAVIYDAFSQLYWVTLFEASELLAVNERGAIVHRITTHETPRGLALTRDQRLLVSHAMTGQLSIYQLSPAGIELSNVITLATEHDPDETVSQGSPRLLDDIALSFDETEAWLPHVLWNFDHPFQFQSTVFPAISIIDLTRGKEHEKVEQRKQLFQQINIVDNSNRTRIVSNPHDAEFSADDRKVYVTLAGSEDLIVFDRSRASRVKKKVKKKRSKRRQGKLSQGGAKASQILRHLPGDNPRGLLVIEDALYVQNAMSQDVVLLDRGVGAFAKAKIKQASLYQTVMNDPLTPQQRQGSMLFNQANTDQSKSYPMAGDFWMSCNSCHLDGFNFTNRYLIEGRQQNKYEDAVLGHGRLNKMIVGDFLADYVRIIQDTQGGMGGDDRDGAEPVDPAALPTEVLADMSNLHQYIIAGENLPRLTTWLRLEDGSRRTVHNDEWINSAACASCHSAMFEQWADSNHRLMGGSNPYYSVLEDVAAATEGEEFRAWCSSCHNPERVLIGKPFRGHKNLMFEKQGASLKQDLIQGKHGAKEGTGCLFCHRITKLEDAGGNAAMTVNLKDRQQYVFENSKNTILNWLGENQINAKPDEHKKSYSQTFYKDELYCKSCHNEFSPGPGAMIVDTWGEWEASSFNNPEQPEKHLGCIDCHMHGDVERIGEDIAGVSTDGGRIKDNVVTHQFTGANHFLLGLRNKSLEKMSIDLLKTSAKLEQSVVKNKLTVRVNNVGAGHSLPTGVADFRQFWLSVQVVNVQGEVMFESGGLDAQGHLDNNARIFLKEFGDKQGKPVGLRFWRYEKMLKDTRIPANGYRDEVFELPDSILNAAKEPLTVITRLMYRVYPQWVTDTVQTQYPELPTPDAIVLNRIEMSLR